MRKRNKEKDRRWRRRYYLANKSKHNAESTAWQKANPEKMHMYKLRRYGITVEEYAELLEKQNGACAICKQPQRYKLAVDHDHKCCSGKNACGQCVRGLLCRRCNVALAMFGDDLERLRNAIIYLGGEI